MRAMIPTFVILGRALSFQATAEPPRVVEAVPDHGDTGVDPAMSELRIVFDQDMAEGRSLCGGGTSFPKLTGQPRWVTAREFVVPVALEPGHQYHFSINCRQYRNFRSIAGEACEITPVSFMTAAVGESPVGSEPLTPEQNSAAFDALKAAIRDRYSYRDRVVKDWDGVFVGHRPELLSARTKAAFARGAARALSVARDPHTALLVGEAMFPTMHTEIVPNVDARLLESVVPHYRRASSIVATGELEDGIAYIQISGWPADAALLAPAHEFLTEHADAPGVVIDVRSNGGGDEPSARRFAGRFCRQRAVYSRDRFRDTASPDGWTKTFDRLVGPEDAADPVTGATPRPCRAPVVVLIGPACMSSNESFVLMMRFGAGASLVGAQTCGSSGNPRRIDLGIGVQVRLPSWEDQLPDGTVLEGHGVAPDLPVEFKGGDGDQVIDAALRRLRDGAK